MLKDYHDTVRMLVAMFASDPGTRVHQSRFLASDGTEQLLMATRHGVDVQVFCAHEPTARCNGGYKFVLFSASNLEAALADWAGVVVLAPANIHTLNALDTRSRRGGI
jgi:hypothetical protein